MPPPAPHARKRASTVTTEVVDLSLARDARRLRDFQARCRSVDELNRKALARLFQTSLIFTRHGSRLGRELLLAHQHLLRVGDLLARIGELPDASASEASQLYREAQSLLARTTELTARCNVALARER